MYIQIEMYESIIKKIKGFNQTIFVFIQINSCIKSDLVSGYPAKILAGYPAISLSGGTIKNNSINYLELDVVLLESVQRQLRLVIDVHLHRLKTNLHLRR